MENAYSLATVKATVANREMLKGFETDNLENYKIIGEIRSSILTFYFTKTLSKMKRWL